MTNPLLGQTIYVDANSLIYALETPALFEGLQKKFVEPFLRGNLQIVTSWITLAEVLVKPIIRGDAKLEAYYRQLIRPSIVCSVVAVDEDIASASATLRAQYGIRLPDSIHIATGKLSGCTCFLTRDAQWAKGGIRVIDPAQL